MLLQEEREKIVVYGQEMLKRGLTAGTFGNLSIYNEKENLFAISPSGMDYFKTDASDVVVMTLDGEKADGDRKPSSEVDMHRIFYQKRPGIKSVVHTHPRYATTLACLGWSIPPLHYLVAYSGKEVPCIPYVPFGTYELARAALDGMGDITPAFSEITVCCASAAISATRWMCPSRSNSAHSSIIIVRQPVRSRSC